MVHAATSISNRREKVSKEIKCDRPGYLGTAVNDYCSMQSSQHTATRNSRRFFLVVLIAASICANAAGAHAQSSGSKSAPGEAGEPYPNMPTIAPIGEDRQVHRCTGFGTGASHRSSEGVSSAGSWKRSLYDHRQRNSVNVLIYGRGVAVIDAPQTLATNIPKAIAEVSDKPITHLIYSHSHADHIGGSSKKGSR
jgi:Metallo-beta-lactamase superfamily